MKALNVGMSCLICALSAGICGAWLIKEDYFLSFVWFIASASWFAATIFRSLTKEPQ